MIHERHRGGCEDAPLGGCPAMLITSLPQPIPSCLDACCASAQQTPKLGRSSVASRCANWVACFVSSSIPPGSEMLLCGAQGLCKLGYSSMDIITTLFRVVRNFPDLAEFLKLEFIRVRPAWPLAQPG